MEQASAPLGTRIVQSHADIALIDDATIERMRRLAAESPDGRARLCLHHSLSDPVHEMIMALTSANAYPVHRHRQKSESYHILAGELGVLIFDDDGHVLERHLLSADLPKAGRMLRISSMAWHAVVPLSDFVLFHEITSGPFVPGQAETAGFCPQSGAALKEFLNRASAGMIPA